MNHLIVTVGDSFSGRKFDLEVPKDVESEKLLDDILETLRGYAPELQWRISEVSLWKKRASGTATTCTWPRNNLVSSSFWG